MTRLRNTLRAIQMLGPLGIILLCSVVLIAISVNNIFRLNQDVKHLYNLGAERFLYQFIGFDLLSMQASTREYVLYEGGDEISDEFWGKVEELDTFAEEHSMFAVSDAAEQNLRQIRQHKDRLIERFEAISAFVDDGQDASEFVGENRASDLSINRDMA